MKRKQRGVALVGSLLLSVVALLLGLSSTQSSRLEETMAGNQRAATQAQMAAEYGVSTAIADMTGSGNGAPSFSNSNDISSASWLDDPSASSLSAKYRYTYVDGAAVGGTAGDDYVVAQGRVLSGGAVLAQREILVGVSGTNAPPLDAFFVCFGNDCSMNTNGSPTITGDDHELPEDFNCVGVACRTSEDDDSEVELPDSWFPDVDGDEGLLSDKNAWKDFIDELPTSGGNYYSFDGGNLEGDIGGRNQPKVIDVIGGEVTVKMGNGNTSTSGVIIVRDGATLKLNGTMHHEGLIIVEPGGKLDMINGTFTLHGGIVDLEGDKPGAGDDKGYDLNAGGTAELVYSQQSINNLYGVNVGMTSWKEVIDSPSYGDGDGDGDGDGQSD